MCSRNGKYQKECFHWSKKPLWHVREHAFRECTYGRWKCDRRTLHFATGLQMRLDVVACFIADGAFIINGSDGRLSRNRLSRDRFHHCYYSSFVVTTKRKKFFVSPTNESGLLHHSNAPLIDNWSSLFPYSTNIIRETSAHSHNSSSIF